MTPLTDLILYLSADKAAFITGANYVIDGGRITRIFLNAALEGRNQR